MLNITENAQEKIAELIKSAMNDVHGIRITADAKSPLKAEYRIDFVKDYGKEDDAIMNFADFDVYIAPASYVYLKDANMDYVDNEWGGEFRIENPNMKPPDLKGPVAEKVKKLLEEQINPAIATHGGFVTLIDVKDSTVYIELGGGCKGCGMVDVTLKQGIEVMLKENVPEITEILDVTDHASGTNPYYQPSAK